MAGARWDWKTPLAMAALFVCATTVGFAQTSADRQTGSLTGRLTDLYSNPLIGARVTVRNRTTGTEAHAISQKNGSYRFSGLEPGEYSLDAESPLRGHGQVEGIVVASGQESRVQVALELRPGTTEPVQANLRRAGAQQLQSDAINTNAAPSLAVVGATSLISAKNLQDRIALATESMTLTATLALEPLEVLVMAGRSWANASALTQTVTSKLEDQSALNANETVKAETTSTLTAELLQSLPISGRRWQDFVLGAQTATAASQTHTAQSPASLTVDGVTQGLAFGGTNEAVQSSETQGLTSENGSSGSGTGESALGRSWAGGHGLVVSESAIRAVQTAAGTVESESIRSGGSRINVQTESGGNGLHGQGFFFDRQNSWGAKNPYSTWVKETSLATLTAISTFTAEPYSPSDHETTWGFGLGSQIRKNKLFWFAALDSFRRNNPGLATVKHPEKFFAQPTNDQMHVLSARLGLSSVSPVTEGVAAYSSMLETLAGLLGPTSRSSAQWAGFARLDWQATERNRFTLEGLGAHSEAPGGGLSRVSEHYGSHSFGSTRASEEWLMGRWETFLTPNLLLVSQGSARREVQGALPQTPSDYEQTLLSGNAWGQLPQITVDSRYGFTIGNSSRFGQGSYPDEHVYHGKSMLDWVRGSLLLRTGFEMSHSTDATSLLRNQTGTYYYSSAVNFASDALAFKAFGTSGQLNPLDQHNCDQTGKVWRDSAGTLRGLGYLPCYSYYSQMIGPANWWLSTNDWAGFTTAQWQPVKQFVLSAGVRFEREQTPSPIAALLNTDLPLTEKLPTLGNSWGPRFGVALGSGKDHWPVLRLGYGMYFGRTTNAVLETALTQTGSLEGDLYYFMRPTDNLNSGGAPAFPAVLTGDPGSVVKPGAVEFAQGFRNPEIHQAEVSVEETLPGRVQLTATAEVSLGRRLPISIDTNIDPTVKPLTITYNVIDDSNLGPITSSTVTVPFYTGRLNSNYQQITAITSRANSTYEAATMKLVRNSTRGLSLRASYAYAHAMDWNPNESTQVAGNNVLDFSDFKSEYGTSNLDVRHSASTTVVLTLPWKLHGLAGDLGNGWSFSGIGQYHSGRPYSMRTSGSLPKEFNASTGAAIIGLGTGMNGSGGDNRVYGVGRNTYRYPAKWKADLRLSRRFKMESWGQVEVLAESFNLFNHRNVTQLETVGYYIEPGSINGALPTLNFNTDFGQPLSVNAANSYRERQIQLGLKLRF